MASTKALPTAMQAWQLSNTADVREQLKLNALAAVPALKANQTLIKVQSMSLNPVDYKLVEIPLAGRFIVSRPCTPGMDYAGRVWATTLPDDAGIKAGDYVFGTHDAPGKYGTLAAFTTLTGKEGVVKSPGAIDPDHLATIGVAGLTAYQTLVPLLGTKDGDGRGKTVFINGGSGGVGTFGIQIAKVLGAKVITSCSGGNASLVRELGADVVIDYKTQNVLETLISYAQENGKIDMIADNVGNIFDIYWKAHEIMKPEGKFLLIGAAPSPSLLMSMAMVYLLPAVLGGGRRPFELIRCKPVGQQLAQIAQWMKENKVKPVVDETFAMEDAVKAFGKLKTGRTRGKVVVRVTEEGR